MNEKPQPKTAAKPYFVPASIAWDELPLPVQAAFEQIVQPTYDELVLEAKTAMERTAGMSLCFLTCVEVLDQFALGEGMNFSGASREQTSADRDKQIARYLRVFQAKQTAANFLLRLRVLRTKQDPLFPATV